MASSSVSQEDVENDFEKLEKRSRIRTARARQINPQVCISSYVFSSHSCHGVEHESGSLEDPHDLKWPFSLRALASKLSNK